ncbi:CopG family transcriptional regulator [Thiorhodococcus minor]|uniref:CopG family transcriptional regulator n=1 Tax=Thiorhodococcus minor TaxID=57489 RepID=A0A6M0JWB4_9GAMM|nr:CopG family transcriptional regulator [Thiorhodococcus minor]NEV60607.1 CopG family transcriptional regulator [Thiorhodococcus minor]
MGQVTIYLDDETESRLKASAKSKGVPVSRWIAELVREKTGTEWPEEVRQLAGAWPDFPDAETLRGEQAEDVRRESF